MAKPGQEVGEQTVEFATLGAKKPSNPDPLMSFGLPRPSLDPIIKAELIAAAFTASQGQLSGENLPDIN